ncbi:MAG TPA: helix-turn-helix domain-containing GNAT family N-acetyltransferase [Thermoleophilaceae bacterium]|jgi:DNA-binding MarR family transcriptional regulator/ribosomal protein S18 acetylase RimI-like enzyme
MTPATLTSADEGLDERVAAVRSFNRFYTGVIGLIGEEVLSTPYTLTEARVIFELGQREATELVDLRRDLDLDAGYLSRILDRFEAGGLASRERSPADGRRQVARLTERGREAFEMLDTRSAREVGALLSAQPPDAQRRLVAAMASVRRILEEGGRAPVGDGGGAAGAAPGELRLRDAAPGERLRDTAHGELRLRDAAPGDMGWVVERHAAVYLEEFGWDAPAFEALIARIVADHLERRDPARERGWIAEVGGERAGCVLCVPKDDATAQLRLLLVDPWARGRGVASRLVDECVGFAREAGYREMTLWTHDVLEAAGRIYRRAGFELVDEEAHSRFGPRTVGQSYRLVL